MIEPTPGSAEADGQGFVYEGMRLSCALVLADGNSDAVMAAMRGPLDDAPDGERVAIAAVEHLAGIVALLLSTLDPDSRDRALAEFRATYNQMNQLLGHAPFDGL